MGRVAPLQRAGGAGAHAGRIAGAGLALQHLVGEGVERHGSERAGVHARATADADVIVDAPEFAGGVA